MPPYTCFRVHGLTTQQHGFDAISGMVAFFRRESHNGHFPVCGIYMNVASGYFAFKKASQEEYEKIF